MKMGLNEIRDRINEDTENEVSKVIEEGKNTASKVIADTKQDMAQQKTKFDEETKAFVEEMEKRAVTDARFEVRKRLLEKKKQILAQVFDEVRKELIRMPDSTREKWIKSILEKVKNELDVKYVYASSRDVKFIPEYNPQEAAIIGGVIVENSDKSMRIDYSFDSLLDDIKGQTLQEVAKILFS